MNKFSFSLTLIGLGSLTGIIYLASIGNIAAIVLISIMATVFLIAIGFGMGHLADIREHRQSIQWTRDMKVEFQSANELQRLINSQNSQLWKQAKDQARLPEPKRDEIIEGDIVEMDMGSFEAL